MSILMVTIMSILMVIIMSIVMFILITNLFFIFMVILIEITMFIIMSIFMTMLLVNIILIIVHYNVLINWPHFIIYLLKYFYYRNLDPPFMILIYIFTSFTFKLVNLIFVKGITAEGQRVTFFNTFALFFKIIPYIIQITLILCV